MKNKQGPGSAGGGYTVRVLSSMEEVPAAAWDALVGAADSPFLEWRFLQAMEEAGCVVPERGWQPMHLTFWRGGPDGEELCAAAPAYLKGNSEGEFVFDWEWADVARRLGVDYYPKLIAAVPFTPATGARLLVRPDLAAERGSLRIAFAEALRVIAARHGLSSAHVLFPEEDEAAALGAAGLLRRVGVQFHWHNEGYRDFADFLSRFSAKRRAMLRRERREVQARGVHVQTQRGPFSEVDVAVMYELYLSTVDKFVWGRRYLNEKFFALLAARMPDRLELVTARQGGADGRILAGAINLCKAGRLYGRYWGQLGEEVPFLHFEVCYYHSIERCITEGLVAFEPGAGGEHKLARGFLPTLTQSAHLIRDARLAQVLGSFLVREEAAVRAAVARERAESPLLCKKSD